jgi:hypothetical protein
MRMNDTEQMIAEIYFGLKRDKENLKRCIQDSQAKIAVIEEMLTNLEITLNKSECYHHNECFEKEERVQNNSPK